MDTTSQQKTIEDTIKVKNKGFSKNNKKIKKLKENEEKLEFLK